MVALKDVHANIPAADLRRARTFYTTKLGLVPVLERAQAIRFETPAGTWFEVYETAAAGTGKQTVAQWDVDDLAATVAELADRGVRFEHYDMPGVAWDGAIADVDGERVAWFTDSEGNVLCLDERPGS